MAEEDILKLFNETDLFYNISVNRFSDNNAYSAVGFTIKKDFSVDNVASVKHWAGACHASVKSLIYDADYIYTRGNRAFKDHKGAILFYDWLLNKSSLRNAFVNKDPEQAAAKGTLLRAAYPATAWLPAAQLARFSTSEFRNIFKAVCTVLADGYEIHPMLLSFAACLFNVNVEKDYYVSKGASSVLVYGSAHMPFASMSTTAAAKALCCDTPIEESLIGDKIFKERGSWPANTSSLLIRRASSSDYTALSIADFTLKEPIKVGQRVEAAKEEVTSLWKNALVKLEKYVKQQEYGTPAASGSLNLNLNYLVQLTKTLELGK